MNNPNIARLLAGIGIVSIGVLALLGNLSIIDFSSLWGTWWPVILIGAGVLIFIANSKDYIWSGLFILAGVAFLTRQLGYNDINIFSLIWPVVIIAIGISLLLEMKRRPASRASGEDNYFTLLSGSEGRNTSKDYRGGKATAIMGGVSLDLRDAHIKKDAVLEVFVLMGGVEVQVPKGWLVKSQAVAILGGVENKVYNEAKSNAPTLTIVGNVIMGGVEVK